MPKLDKFLKALSIEPKDISIYRKALTHISSAPTASDSYERLEFLGDSVIGVVISDFLYRKFPQKEEGDLSRIKASVVSRDTLGAKAIELGLDKYLRADTVRVREGRTAEFSIMSDCFEAVVGAIFADRGYRAAKAFIIKNLKEECMILKEMQGPSDFKSRLQEFWQQKCKATPEYRVISEEGPDHSKIFSVEVRYRGKTLGIGQGSSKKKAEQEAARMAYEAEIIKPKKRARSKAV
jgi:ribonuclease III